MVCIYLKDLKENYLMSEKKKVSTPKIMLIAGLLCLVVVVIAGSIILYKALINKEEESTEVMDLEEGVELDNADIELVVLNNSAYGISLNPEFELTSSIPLTEKIVQQHLAIEPKREIIVKEASANKYTISFTEPLEENKIVKLRFNKGTQELGWAFQTLKHFGIAASFPTNDGYDVPINSGIELYFTGDAPEKIDDYFTIIPEVAGKFTYLNNKIVFIPDEDLPGGATYQISIAPSYSNGTETLGKPFEFQFTTSYSDSDGERFEFYSVDTILSPYRSQVISFFADNLNDDTRKIDLNLYKITDADSYINGLEYYRPRSGYSSTPYDVVGSVTYTDLFSFKSEIITSTEENYYNNNYIEIPEVLSEGFYLLEVKNIENTTYMFIQVTKYQAYFAVDSSKIVTFAVDTKNNIPAEGLSIRYHNNNLGSTNQEGILDVEFSETIDSDDTPYIIYTDQNDESFALNFTADNYYYDYYYFPTEKKNYWNFLYSDRSTYLPTDTIQLFGFAQGIDKTAVTEVKLVLRNEDLVLDEKTVPVTNVGTYNATFEITNFLDYGVSVDVYDGERLIQNKYLSVMTFEKPTYKIETSIDPDFLMIGDSVTIQAKSMFFEGTPMQFGSILMENNSYSGTFDGQTFATLNCDENGAVTTTVYPDSDNYSKSWQPFYYNLSFTSGEYQMNYYSTYDGFIFFPRQALLESNFVKNSETSVTLNGKMNAIDLSAFTGELDDMESFRGSALSNQEVNLSIQDSYYEKVFEGQAYDYINKTTYDKYTYNYIQNTIINTALTTDESGNISFLFDKVEKEHGYTFTLTTQDQTGRIIEVTRYYNNASYYDYMDYYYDGYYNITTNQENYTKGDTVQASITFDNNEIEDTTDNFTFFMTCKDGILAYDFTEDFRTSFTYDDNHISNAYIFGVYYDGKKLIKPWSKPIYYDYKKDAHLSIELACNSTDYQPGDLVELEISVTDPKGSPVQADVNLSVVDEAYFVLFEDYFKADQALYSPDFSSGILYEKLFVVMNDLARGSGAEMGGEGDSMTRSDFKNTASFTTITTDSLGQATTSFTLPDNLTNWRITANAVSSDLKAGQNTCNVNSKLPFFINDVLFDHYLSEDDIVLTLFTAGTDAYAETEVKYHVGITDESGKKTEIDKTSTAQKYTNIPLGKLSAGTYVINATAEGNGMIDGFEKTIQVVDTLQYFKLNQTEALSENMNFTPHENAVALTFLNKKAAEHYSNLMNIYWTSSKRLDYQALAFTAANYVKNTYDSELTVETPDYSAFLTSNLFREQPYAAESAEITAYVLKSDLYKQGLISDNDLKSIKQGLSFVQNNGDATIEENYAAMWALSILNEPVLLNLYVAQSSEAYLSSDLNLPKLYTLLSLIELGDYQNALKVYHGFVTDYGTVTENKINFVGDDSRKLTAMMMMSATMLGEMKDAKKMYETLESGKDVFSPTICERLIYLMSTPPKDILCSFDYTLDGTTESFIVDYAHPAHLTLSAEQAEDIRFNNIEGDVEVLQEFFATVEDIKVDDSYRVERSYNVNGNTIGSSSIKQGDVVEVSITVSSKDSRTIEVNDILPAGLIYYSSDYTDATYYQNKGNQVNIYYYGFNNQTTQVTFKYYAIAVASGTYTADYVVVKNLWGESANYGKQVQITIE